ncbi:MAG: elongation factor P maturation arginine rhamnosyltransferase EarP, partial [Nitrosomonas sp.]
YETAPVERLVQILRESTVPVSLFVPEGSVALRISTFLGEERVCHQKKLLRKGHLTVQIFPWFEQAEYDRLLWSCDINIVRGEDSFVRAQWAAKPFVWTIYPQTEGAHWHKLDAFLLHYTAGMETEMAAMVQTLWTSWNGKIDLNPIIWMNFLALQKSLIQHNNEWVDQLLKQSDLTSNLVQFVENRL